MQVTRIYIRRGSLGVQIARQGQGKLCLWFQIKKEIVYDLSDIRLF
jgi:hypothetical protein